jgi:hypothetical protein
MDYKRKDTYLEYIEVETVTLDRFLQDKKRVDFLRMDLEGFECQVIDGMRRTLETQGPNILFEIHPLGEIDPDPRYTPYLDYLMTLGYRPKTLVCPARRETLTRFGELGYRPQKTVYNGMVKSVRFNDIRPEDLIKVAARRPKITRAIYLTRG